jgi:hypothetical protein
MPGRFDGRKRPVRDKKIRKECVLLGSGAFWCDFPEISSARMATPRA